MDVQAINSGSPTMPIKIIASPSKKFQQTSATSVQQQFKTPQTFVTHQHSQMVINRYYVYTYNIN